MKKLLLFFTLNLYFTVFSQPINKAKLDSFFQALETNNKFMGSVAVSQNGKITYTRQIGFADVENKIRPNESTKYRIGSISKTFTTVLVLKAVEEKKLKLTDIIGSYFPTIKNSDKITIGDLLYHRSGIHNFTAVKDYLKWNTQKKTEAELIEKIASSGSDFEPGTKAEYSNSNFLLLSFILQKIYNKEYALLLKERITQPLSLENTYFGKPINPKDNECYSYTYEGHWKKEPETDMSIPMGAGAIVSTPSDLTKFADALFGGNLISQKSLEQMMSLKDDFGMGLFKVPFVDKFGYGHNGGIDGFTSVMYHFADGNVSMALTSNGTNFDNNQISIALLGAVYNVPFNIPSFKAINLTSEELEKYLGIYSSTELPLKITITKKGNTLIAQATGQSSFPLIATEKDKFTFDQAGILLKFDPTNKTMVLQQGGGMFQYVRE